MIICNPLQYLQRSVLSLMRLRAEGVTHHVVTASRVLEAEPHVALVVDRGCVRELVRLEVDLGGCLGLAVVERSHDLVVDWAPVQKETARC